MASATHILQKFSNFCCKIEIFVAFHTHFASNITLLLRLMITNKFFDVQTFEKWAKIPNSGQNLTL